MDKAWDIDMFMKYISGDHILLPNLDVYDLYDQDSYEF